MLPEDWRKAALSAIQLPQGKSVSQLKCFIKIKTYFFFKKKAFPF